MVRSAVWRRLSRWLVLGMGLLVAPQVGATPRGHDQPPRARERPTRPAPRDLLVPTAQQTGDVANCGPTAAAMVLAAYWGVSDPAHVGTIRSLLGTWSWMQFPERSWHLPGQDPGMVTPAMMLATLQRFGHDVRFERLTNKWIPGDAYALAALRWSMAAGRPVVALVSSDVLWGTKRVGLHWVVVSGLHGDHVVYNDPGDACRFEMPVSRFLEAWRLRGVFRLLPGFDAYTAFVGDRAVPGFPATRAGLVAAFYRLRFPSGLRAMVGTLLSPPRLVLR